MFKIIKAHILNIINKRQYFSSLERREDDIFGGFIDNIRFLNEEKNADNGVKKNIFVNVVKMMEDNAEKCLKIINFVLFRS